MYCYNIRFWYYYLLASLRYPSSCVVRHTLCFRPTAQAAVPPAYKPFPVKSRRAWDGTRAPKSRPDFSQSTQVAHTKDIFKVLGRDFLKRSP